MIGYSVRYLETLKSGLSARFGLSNGCILGTRHLDNAWTFSLSCFANEISRFWKVFWRRGGLVEGVWCTFGQQERLRTLPTRFWDVSARLPGPPGSLFKFGRARGKQKSKKSIKIDL